MPTQALALRNASFVGWRRREVAPARAWAEQALPLWRELGDRHNEGLCLLSLSVVAQFAEDHAAYQAFSASAAAIFRDIGAHKQLGHVLHNDGLHAIMVGDYARARECLEEALASARAIGNRDNISNGLCDLGVVALYERRLEDAVDLFGQSLELASESRWHLNVAYDLGGLGCALASLGELAASARLLGVADAIHERLGEPLEPYAARAYDECSEPVRSRLDEPELAAAWATGRAMSEADAAAYAQSVVAERVPALD